VPRVLPVPSELTRAPFTLDEARRQGLARWRLKGKAWCRIGPGTYIHSGVPETPLVQIEAASRRVHSEGAFSGLTAAWLHGLDVEPCNPIEFTVPHGVGISSRAGMKLRRCDLPADDVVIVSGFRATSVLRVLRDVCLGSSLTEAVVMVDMALHAGLASLDALHATVNKASGKQGVQLLRRAARHAEPKSESQMETRLRMTIVLGGLPRPEAQVTIRAAFGATIGRVDLYYPAQRLGIEYDGATHEGSLADDNRRQNRLFGAGIRLLRFTAADVYRTPQLVVRQVRDALSA
jgi:very-short-patch-repair endonuclease